MAANYKYAPYASRRNDMLDQLVCSVQLAIFVLSIVIEYREETFSRDRPPGEEAVFDGHRQLEVAVIVLSLVVAVGGIYCFCYDIMDTLTLFRLSRVSKKAQTMISSSLFDFFERDYTLGRYLLQANEEQLRKFKEVEALLYRVSIRRDSIQLLEDNKALGKAYEVLDESHSLHATYVAIPRESTAISLIL